MVAQVPPRKYRIERYLAEGGMGAIYLGKKIGAGGFEKEVVLKQLLPEFTSRAEFRDLFFREAKISASLDHQNIVRTFDLVKSDDRLFIVMEYVRGADLRSISWRARRKRPLSPQAVLHVALEILAGLAYAHARRSPTGEPLGIIHRDLSPSNILCSGQGEAKLSDFGIAKAVTYSSVFYRVRGKVGYMSPEMAHNLPIDARSDLFSMGVSIYETLIGERIYSGDLNTPADQIYAQAVPPLAKKCPGLPPELQGVLDKSLALNREQRFQDAESFADALREVARKHNLLYSAPQLAAELRELLGPNPDAWLSDENEPGRAQTARPPGVPPEVAGLEASSVSAEDDLGPITMPETPTPPTVPPAPRRPPASSPLASQPAAPGAAPPPLAPGMVRPSQQRAVAAPLAPDMVRPSQSMAVAAPLAPGMVRPSQSMAVAAPLAPDMVRPSQQRAVATGMVRPSQSMAVAAPGPSGSLAAAGPSGALAAVGSSASAAAERPSGSMPAAGSSASGPDATRPSGSLGTARASGTYRRHPSRGGVAARRPQRRYGRWAVTGLLVLILLVLALLVVTGPLDQLLSGTATAGGGLPWVQATAGGGLSWVPATAGGGLPWVQATAGGGLPWVPVTARGGLPWA